MEDSNKKPNLWMNLLFTFLGTTLSILLTFGSGMLVEKNKQKEERELTAMMVMGNKMSQVAQRIRYFSKFEAGSIKRDSVLCLPFMLWNITEGPTTTEAPSTRREMTPHTLWLFAPGCPMSPVVKARNTSVVETST